MKIGSISVILSCITPFISFIIDLMLGDPSWIVHPVVLMGRAISFLEKKLRGVFAKTAEGEKRAGLLTAMIMLFGTLLITWGIYYLVIRILGTPGVIILTLIDIFWGFQAIAVKSMLTESRNVYEKLSFKGLEDARVAVGRIVGRDTGELSAHEIARAAIESVAESFSDGVAAPMLYLAFLGAPSAMAYKAVNTMDSMIGYKNERYLYYGRAAARLDDVANFIPSRLAALVMIIATYIWSQRGRFSLTQESGIESTGTVLFDSKIGQTLSQTEPSPLTQTLSQTEPSPLTHPDKISGSRAFMIWKRDRFNHESPNSAQTESAMSGALGVRLGGGASYFGEYHDKPVIGGEYPEPDASDILRANRIFLTASVIFTFLCTLFRTAVIVFLKHYAY